MSDPFRGECAMGMMEWEAKVLATPRAAVRIAKIEKELRKAVNDARNCGEEELEEPDFLESLPNSPNDGRTPPAPVPN